MRLASEETISDESPTPLSWHTLPHWLRDTRRVDDAHRPPHRRPAKPRPLSRWWRARLADPVFVVGAPRSGTSFLGRALAALPELSYHYEPPLAKVIDRCVYEGEWSEARAARWLGATYRWLMCRRGEGDLRLLEKTPQHCFSVAFLIRAFPGARFVHIVRDGRDAALSYSRQPWLSEHSAGSGRRETGGYPLGPVPRFWVEPERRDEFRRTSDWHRCIWAWRRFVEAAQAGLAELPRERVCELRYEQVVAQPRDAAEQLARFLAVDLASSRQALVDSLCQAHGPGVGVWRNELTAAQLAIAEAEAGRLLQRLGYALAGGANQHTPVSPRTAPPRACGASA
jgi:hypothetical protein